MQRCSRTTWYWVYREQDTFWCDCSFSRNFAFLGLLDLRGMTFSVRNRTEFLTRARVNFQLRKWTYLRKIYLRTNDEQTTSKGTTTLSLISRTISSVLSAVRDHCDIPTITNYILISFLKKGRGHWFSRTIIYCIAGLTLSFSLFIWRSISWMEVVGCLFNDWTEFQEIPNIRI